MDTNNRHNLGTVEGSWAEYLWEHGEVQHRESVGSVSGVGTTYFVHCFDTAGMEPHPETSRWTIDLYQPPTGEADLGTLVFIVVMAAGPPPTRVVVGTAFTTMTQAFKWAANQADRELASELAL